MSDVEVSHGDDNIGLPKVNKPLYLEKGHLLESVFTELLLFLFRAVLFRPPLRNLSGVCVGPLLLDLTRSLYLQSVYMRVV
jgi:hypothetical protein